MKASPIQANFIGGEFSQLLNARVDSDIYPTAVSICKNYIPLIQGPLTRRPGSYFVQKTKNSGTIGGVRLQKFEFSTTQAYILEFGSTYLRFYRNNGPVETSPGVPYEIVTNYGSTHLFDLKFTQSADILYITHPLYPPMKLTRTAHTSWTLVAVNNQDGPYLPQNVGAITLTPSATTGSGITITASTAIFAVTDVGRLIRIKHGSTWGNALITGYTSTTVVTAQVGKTFGATTAVTIWRLGLWSLTTGYPAASTFHEDRLFFSGSSASPQRVDGSYSGDYENFEPTAADGVITAANAVSFTLNSNDVNVVKWMTSDERGLLVGTAAGEWTVRAASVNEALNATNITAKKASNYGSTNVQPIQVGKSALFVQKSGRKLRDMRYYYDVDGFRAADLTILSEHITRGGIVQLAFQKDPQQIVWAVRADGILIGMTYEREFETVKAGWHRHHLGGKTMPLTSADATVESIACIPSADGTRDELWLAVRRYVNGLPVTFVEYLTKIFDNEDEQREAFFVDAGLSYDNPQNFAPLNPANPQEIWSFGHGLSTGNKILITNTGLELLDEKIFLAVKVDDDYFTLTDVLGNAIDGSALSFDNVGGKFRKLVSTVSGLSHLEGETVQVCTDGAAHPDRVVTSGAITLAYPAATVHVGLGYQSDGQQLRLEAGSTDGTAHGKTQRISRIGWHLHRSLGLQYGVDFAKLQVLTFRKTSDINNKASDLYSGILSVTVSANYNFDNQICWRQEQPLPSTILAIMPQLTTQDRQ